MKPRRAKRLNFVQNWTGDRKRACRRSREPDDDIGRGLISNEPWYSRVQFRVVKACKLKVGAKNELAPASAASCETGGSITSA